MTGPITRTVPALLARAEQEFPDLEAVVDGGVRWSFAELAAEVRRCAAAMMASGVHPGERVSIWAPNGHRFVIAALGAMSAGAVLVPINTRYRGDEAYWILAKSRARLLFTDDGFLDNDYVAMLRHAAEEQAALEAAEPGSGSVPGLPGLGEIVTFGRRDVGSAGGPATFTAFLARSEQVSDTEVRARAGAVGEDDISDMFFTSGTTGRPKGAMTSHAQNIRVYEAWADGVGLRHGDRYLLVNPLFHTFGFKAGLLACLIRGATLVPQEVFHAGRSLQLIRDERITVVPGPPTLYAGLLNDPDRAAADTSSLRLAVTGAAVVPVALVERMRAELFPEVVIAYGMTETCGTATVGDPHADAETISRTVGKAIPGAEVAVVDLDGNRLPPGVSGEVTVRGYNVMQGYFEDAEATKAAIDADGWLHTGDVGLMDEQGNLRITDRLKDMFVVGGFNAYPAEIEQMIMRHPKVSEAAAVGIPDERLGEVCRAYVIPRHGAELTEHEIVEYCRERLANFKVPREVLIVGELPRNASGKVLKYVLREQAGEQTALQHEQS